MKFVYPPQLPISAQKDRIEKAVRSSRVVIIQGQTGSGKTTQIPKMLLEMGYGTHGRQIAHTQPRRIAARSVAERLCEETGTRLGEEIGYQVRFDDRSNPSTRLRIMTDGILLAQIQRDPLLRRYDAIIIDEAHERSLNIDFLLGYLTELLPKRRDLRLIVTSATIDAEKFQKHFADALGEPVPVIEVSGRTYPVTVLYEPTGSAPQLCPVAGFDDLYDPAGEAGDGTGADDGAGVEDMPRQVARAMAEILEDSKRISGPRDVLVFASGQRDIRDFEQAIRSALPRRTADMRRPDAVELVPLYARLSAAEQHRVFEHHTRQRVIIATNVAETSLTVPDIRYVVDPGTARISRYSKTAKVQRLPIEPISQASADQRAGRTGRVADGICIRLYSEEDYLSRPEFTDPEILRTSLGQVVLHMLSVGVAHTAQDVTDFGFIDPPDTRAVSDGITELNELGALAGTSGTLRLTATGRRLARIPIDDRLGRMILEAAKIGTPEVLADIIVIVAFLSLQDPRERPEDKREDADRLHNRYADTDSDFLTILNIWDRFFGPDAKKMSNSQLRRRAVAEFFNYLRLRQWRDLVSQLRVMGRQMRMKVGAVRPVEATDRTVLALPVAQQGKGSLAEKWDGDSVHRAMLAGLLSNMGHQILREPKASDFVGLKGAARQHAIRRAKRQNKNLYQGARNTRFAIFPSSPLSKTTPEWVIASDLMETSRLWARMAAKIDPAWALPLAGSLTRTTYSEPHWSAASGSAVATKTVLLYGLPIVAGARVQWSRVNPAQARQFLLRQGMVEDGIRRRFPHDDFLARNRKVLENSSEEASRTRRITQSVNDEDLFEFYDRTVPADVTGAAELASWWRRTYAQHPRLLDFDPGRDVRRTTAGSGLAADEYPSVWLARATDGSRIPLRLTYAYTPGRPGDGISVHIPLRYLPRLEAGQFTWLVPGMRRELVAGLIKALPKQLRVQFVPAPASAQAIDEWITARLDDAPAPGLPGDGGTGDDGTGDGGTDDDGIDVAVSKKAGTASASAEPLGTATVRTLAQARKLARARQEVARTAQMEADDAPRGAELARLPFARVFSLAAIAVRGAQIHPRVVGQYWDRLADHLRVTFVVEKDAPRFDRPRQDHDNDLVASFGPSTSSHGGKTWKPEVLGSGKSLTDLQSRLAAQAQKAAATSVGRSARTARKNGKAVASATLLHTAGATSTPRGEMIREAALKRLHLPPKRISSRWLGREALALTAAPYPSTDALAEDMERQAVRQLLPDADRLASDAALEERIEQVRDLFEDKVYEVAHQTIAVLAADGQISREVSGSATLPLLAVLQSIREHIASLVFPGFIGKAPAGVLEQMPRYLKADGLRLEKAKRDRGRDVTWAWQADEALKIVRKAQKKAADTPAGPARDEMLRRAEATRWLYEEFRVSLWAQELGVLHHPSIARLEKTAAGKPLV